MISFSTAFLSSATLLSCSGVLRVAASPLADGARTHTIAKNRNTFLGGGNTLQLQSRRHLAVDSGSKNVRALFGPDDACEYGPLYLFSGDSPKSFMYYEESIKDFSSYFTMIGDTDYDYTALLELYKEPCEYYGGILYSISGFQACGKTDDADFGKNYTDMNLPYCASPGCDIDESTVYDSEHFNFCEDQEQATREYQVTTVDTSVLSGECKAQLDMFSPKVHPLTALDAVDVGDYDISGDGSEYDLEPTLANFTVLCEVEGGYSYKFSDKLLGNEFSHYNGVGTKFNNQPICLGTSCDATKYFEELFIPAWNFDFDGNFRHKDAYYDSTGTPVAPGNETYPAEQYYTFLGFEAVSDVPTPKPTPSPTSDDSTSSSPALLVSIFAATLSLVVSSAMML